MKIYRYTRLRYLRAFTLLELMVSISILAILLALGVSRFDYLRNARNLDGDWHQVGSLLRLAQQQSVAMGSGQQIGTGPTPLVIFTYDPGASPSATCAVVYDGPSPAATSDTIGTKLLEQFNVDTAVVMAPNGLAAGTTFSITFYPGVGNGTPYASFSPPTATATPSIVFTDTNVPGQSHTLTVDSNTGGVSYIQ